MSKCVIFTGGIIENYSELDVSDFKNSYIICADAGYLHAKKLGLHVDVLIGDMDTLGEIPDDADEVQRFKSEKDDTDTNLAVKLALKRGYKDIYIYGALGNRVDHTFANIQILSFIDSNNAKGHIVSQNDKIDFLSHGTLDINQKVGFSLSIFSYSDICEGVTLKGVKYPLDNFELSNNFPLGVCNEITDKKAIISLKKGKMLIIQSKIL